MVVCRRPLFFASIDSIRRTRDFLECFRCLVQPPSLDKGGRGREEGRSNRFLDRIERKQWPAGITGYTYELGVDESGFDFRENRPESGRSMV